MKGKLEKIILAVIIVVCLSLPASCAVYKFKDCKKVGHSNFYCVLDLR